jgi:Tol biopolymer transport system component
MLRRRLLSIPLALAALVAVALPAPPAQAAFSGANGRIVFESDRTGTPQIYSANTDGSGVQQLTFLGSNFDPNVSVDGTQIVFVSTRDGTNELYLMGSNNGTPQTRLTTNTLQESHPVWAPSNTLIGFAAIGAGGDSDIYEIKPSGTGLLNLTNNPTAFDADPAWSAGGQTIAFDSTNRNNPGTDVYSMAKEGTNIKQLTETHVDSNPNWSPDNKNIAFESARDVEVQGPSDFAAVQKPLGVLALADHLLVTQANKDKVLSVSNAGAVSTFATLPSTGNLSTERYIDQSPGSHGWPVGEIYVTVGANTYQISPDGTSVTLFVNIPSMPNGETSITFDKVGTFGFNMLLSDRRGPVWAVTTDGVATQIGDYAKQIEGIHVAPLSWEPYGGQLIGANEFTSTVLAMDNNGAVSTVGSWTTPEAAVFVPDPVCNMTGTTGAYFVAMEDMNKIVKFPSSQFAGLTGQAIVPSEEDTSVGQFVSNGSTVSASQFWGPIGDPELEGSDFVRCASSGQAASPAAPGAAAGMPAGPAFAALRSAAAINPAARTYAALVAGPHEIYRMTVGGLNETRLTTSLAFDDIEPVWAPNNQTILFASDQADPNAPACQAAGTCDYQLFTMSANGGTQTDVSNSLPDSDTTSDWQAAGFIVKIVDFAFQPAIAKPKLGANVLWNNAGPTEHTTTDNTGLNLWDSGIVPAGQSFLFKFLSAGKYAYVCTIHPGMAGTVQVPMTASPLSGTVTTTFTFTWSIKANQSGLVFDVQVQRPGETTFSDWLTNTKLASSTFVPDAGTGTYAFRARVRNQTTQSASDYSAPVAITVTP